jgi:predicted phosphoribosyltransferase
VSDNFYALSQYYRSFNQVLDEQVVRLIDKKSVV